MAKKGEVLPDDATKEFSAEKIRMRTAKATMTRAVKRLETAINDYNEFKDLEVDNKDYVAVSREVSESVKDTMQDRRREPYHKQRRRIGRPTGLL